MEISLRKNFTYVLRLFTYIFNIANQIRVGKTHNLTKPTTSFAATKMAKKQLAEGVAYYCQNHPFLSTEAVSTNRYHWMCRGHYPVVYLFTKADAEEMVKFHDGVSFKNFYSSRKFHFIIKNLENQNDNSKL